jgi:2-dehydropantoate 2-reductase
MKICFIGAGALGSSLGGTLAFNGLDVTLIDHFQAHVDKMNQDGLTLIEGEEKRVVKVKAATSTEGLGIMDLVIVLVKSFGTRAAIEKALPIIGENTLVLSLQNGLGNEEIIMEVVGPERVIGGKTYAGGVFLGPGEVIAGTINKLTVIGEMDGRVTERIKNVAAALTAHGLMTEISENIVGMIWDKLLINAATGAISAITRLPYGGLYNVREVKDVAIDAVAEGIAVAKAKGIQLSVEDPSAIWYKAAAGLPYMFKASMLQSIEAGKATEVDFINGPLVRWGEALGIQTPVNKTLVAMIKGYERWMEAFNGKEVPSQPIDWERL